MRCWPLPSQERAAVTDARYDQGGILPAGLTVTQNTTGADEQVTWGLDYIREHYGSDDESAEPEPDEHTCSRCAANKHSRCVEPLCSCCAGNQD